MSFQENCIGCAARVDACPYETKVAEEKLDLSRAGQSRAEGANKLVETSQKIIGYIEDLRVMRATFIYS
jgi:Fe-S-cluster-containing dehydrogenase component